MEKGIIGNYIDAFFKQYSNFSGKATRHNFGRQFSPMLL